MAPEYDAGGPVPFEAPHGAKPGLEAPMISFDSVVRVLSGVVKCGWQELRNDPDQSVGPVGGDLDRLAMGADRIGEELRGGLQVSPLGQEHVDDLPVLVNGAIDEPPRPRHLHVGLTADGSVALIECRPRIDQPR